MDYFSIFGHLHHINENLPNDSQNLPKLVQKNIQTLNKLSEIAKYFLDLAKVAKFRQIWSHWLHTTN